MALVGGVILALAQVSDGPFKRLARVCTDFFRGLPVLIVLFILFFGLAEVGIRLEPLQAAIAGLGMHGAAYMGEIVRAGIESVPGGQLDAGRSVGLTRSRIMQLIVLPQAVNVSLPPTGNYMIALLKDSAIASVVAAPKIMFRARQLVTETFRAGEIYLIVAALYLALSLPLAAGVRYLQRRQTRYRRPQGQRSDRSPKRPPLEDPESAQQAEPTSAALSSVHRSSSQGV